MLKKDFTSEELLTMVREVSSYNGMFEEIGYAYDDLDEFLEIYFPKSIDAIRAWNYGEADYNDDYFRLDSCGNIESLSYNELMEEVEEYKEDIIEEYKSLVKDGSIDDYEEFLKDMEEEDE